MKHFLKSLIACLLALSVVLSMTALVSADNEPLKFSALYVLADSAHENVRVLPQTIGETQYLFLPANMTAKD